MQKVRYMLSQDRITGDLFFVVDMQLRTLVGAYSSYEKACKAYGNLLLYNAIHREPFPIDLEYQS